MDDTESLQMTRRKITSVYFVIRPLVDGVYSVLHGRIDVSSASDNTSDVLRRHWKTCKTRIHDGHEIPEPGRGGKHKRACDSCAVLRKACNGDLPCSACTQREKECTYRRLVEEHLSLPPAQAPSKSTHTEDTIVSSEPAWELGISTLYPSLKMVASRHYDTFGMPEDRPDN